ncbi:conserved hypothetical protein [Crenothrix polyspora]|uniref:DUF4435 domain-containing protein n=1 Tax=Crenothrix polyspora TaxID=360316 RepID=A0A1R4H3X3_9GAMM|nr:DUF4435 domain-containing protein [Crenothrix polyspora]SJM90877.1 conserved hypothetical protein [Crenothrix polyspora]
MRQYLDKNDTIGEIRQARKHPVGKSYLWILVEGLSDQKLYSKLIDGHNTKVEMVNGGGKNELRDALEILIQETNKVIGIRDADFMRFDQQKETINVLFLTDAHDAEMMLLANDVVFQQVVAEYLPAQRTVFNTLRDCLLVSLLFFSGIRWINNTEDLGLNFDGIGLAKFYDANNLFIDKDRCLHEVVTRSPKKKRVPDIAEIDSKLSGVNDYYNLSNGHDFLKAFALHVTANGSRGISHDEIGNALRIAYRKDEFKLTVLFNNLKLWESNTGYVLFTVG